MYYRGEHNELLQLIRWEFEQMREKCEQKKKRLAKMEEDAKEASHDYQELSDQLASSRKIRDEWFQRHITYMQMINELSPYETPEQIQQAENCCFNKSDWVLKVDEESWVNCFKKYSNTDAKIKGYLAKLEEKPNAEPWKPWTCPIPPFKSHELLKKIQVNGSVSCVLRYLEYLTLVCNV